MSFWTNKINNKYLKTCRHKQLELNKYVLILQQEKKKYLTIGIFFLRQKTNVPIVFLQYSNIRSQCQQAQVVIMTER
jgi:DUF1680 family protein